MWGGQTLREAGCGCKLQPIMLHVCVYVLYVRTCVCAYMCMYHSLPSLLLTCATLQYKYQLNVDGTVAAYRFPYLLAGNSLVLKQDSPFYEHFYSKLEPWTHYVPLKRDLSDVVEKVQWAREHDEEVSRLGVGSTVEPLYRGHHRDPASCHV